MYSARGRGGPRQQTPANVQCQKCLKRDTSLSSHETKLQVKLTSPARHYSYECKAAPQERPYVARPSRTQQLLNPKLKPKLTSDVLEPLERKKGVADEELAKKEAERARKRELEKEDDDDELLPKEPRAKRQQSASVDSVSTISTKPSRSPPPRRRASPSPNRAPLRDTRRTSSGARSRSCSSDYDSDHDQRRSPSPVRPARLRESRERSFSPRRDDLDRAPSNRSFDEDRPRYDRSRRNDKPRRHDSRSPERAPVRGRGRGQYDDSQRYRSRDDRFQEQDGRRRRSPSPHERPRSPSPFTKRKALTKAMNQAR